MKTAETFKQSPEQRIRILESMRSGLIYRLRRDKEPDRGSSEKKVDAIDAELGVLYKTIAGEGVP